MTAIASDAATRRDKISPTFGEFLRYFACSACALAVDSSLYWTGLRLGIPYPLAAVIGFVAGVATAYYLSIRWAFDRRSVSNARVEFLIFLAVGVAGLGLTEALLWVQVDVLGVGRMVAKLLASAGVFAFNFGARKLMLFTRRTPPSTTTAG